MRNKEMKHILNSLRLDFKAELNAIEKIDRLLEEVEEREHLEIISWMIIAFLLGGLVFSTIMLLVR